MTGESSSVLIGNEMQEQVENMKELAFKIVVFLKIVPKMIHFIGCGCP